MGRNRRNNDSLEASFSRLSVVESPKKFTPVKVTRNPDIVMKFLYLATGNNSWFHADYNVPYVQVTLKRKTMQFKTVKDAFDESNDCGDEVTSIDRIDNPFLLAQYLLKGRYRRDLSALTKVEKLFHGTKHEYLDSICKTNLDWRRVGKGKFFGNRYGNGVSFSPSSSYASRFPREDTSTSRMMLMCNVLVCSTTRGSPKVKVPPSGSDATGSANGNVIVKYDDNEFYPKYVIYYEEEECSSSESYD